MSTESTVTTINTNRDNKKTCKNKFPERVLNNYLKSFLFGNIPVICAEISAEIFVFSRPLKHNAPARLKKL